MQYHKYNLVDNRLIEQLKGQSMERRKDSKDFQKVMLDIQHFNDQKKRKRISLQKEKFTAQKAELTAEKQEEQDVEEMNDPNRPVEKRDYYLNEVLDIAADYVRMLNMPQAAAIGQR
jgi:carboxyl-terminal processing protease